MRIDPTGMADGDADTKPKPTSFTYTCDYTKRDSNIPFVNTYRYNAGTYTNVLPTGTISDFSDGDEGGGYNVTMRVPSASPWGGVSYTTLTGTGSDLNNLTWTRQGSAGDAFVQGLNNGINAGLSFSVGEAIGTAITAKMSVDKLINSAGKLERLKGGVRQGTINGNIDDIFNSVTKGGKQIAPNRFKLSDGTFVTKYPSSTTGVPTIGINQGSQLYKIRVVK
jgi:hypothetical protein